MCTLYVYSLCSVTESHKHRNGKDLRIYYSMVLAGFYVVCCTCMEIALIEFSVIFAKYPVCRGGVITGSARFTAKPFHCVKGAKWKEQVKLSTQNKLKFGSFHNR